MGVVSVSSMRFWTDGGAVKRSIAGVALIGVLVTGGLSGCDGIGTDPTPSQTASVRTLGASTLLSETPTPGQQPTGLLDVDPPERPAAMDNADEAGAVAAAEYYLRLTVYAAATGDTTELEAMSGVDCAGCKNYISSVKDLYANGGWWTDMPEVTVEKSASRPIVNAINQYQVELAAVKSSYEYYDREGNLIAVDDESAIMGFIVTDSNSWVVDVAQSFPEGTEIGDDN